MRKKGIESEPYTDNPLVVRCLLSALVSRVNRGFPFALRSRGLVVIATVFASLSDGRSSAEYESP